MALSLAASIGYVTAISRTRYIHRFPGKRGDGDHLIKSHYCCSKHENHMEYEGVLPTC